MSGFCHTMLPPTVELLRTAETLVPLGSHSFFEKLWQTGTQQMITEATQHLETDERDEVFEALDLITEGLKIFCKAASNPEWKALSVHKRKAIVKALTERPQIQQRSEEWFQQFGKLLTASEFSAIFVTTKRRQDLAYSKSHPPKESIVFRHACPTSVMNATGWGVRFEPVVKQILEHTDGSKLYEPGRIGHPTNPYLAASPDAIVEDSKDPSQIGRLVEIKCPYSRRIGGEIPSDYWIQMQIQMEVTGIDECDYVECEILSQKATQRGPVDLSGTLVQGCLYLVKQNVPDGAPYELRYLYGEIGSPECPPVPDGFEVVETIPWGLKAWHREIVYRDRVWYEATKPWQEAFWHDVATLRQGGKLEGQKQTQVACLIKDD
jgi:putative phage-type endonuclease